MFLTKTPRGVTTGLTHNATGALRRDKGEPMNYLKTLGLAVCVGLAAAVVLAAGTASATVLCKTTSNPCASPYNEKTLIHAVLKSKTLATFTSGGVVRVTCEESTFQGETKNKGSLGVDVELPLATLTFGKCDKTTTVVKAGSLKFRFKEKGSGTVRSAGLELSLEITGLPCVYGTATETEIGTITEPASDTSDTFIDVNVNLPKISGSGFCPSSITWTSEYTVTSPVPLYLANE